MKPRISLLLFTAACAPLFAASAKPAGTDSAHNFSGNYNGSWMVRARAIEVAPDESSSLSVGGTVNVDNSVVPEVDLTYFFTPNIAVEGIAATTKHNVTTNTGTDAGSAWLLYA